MVFSFRCPACQAVISGSDRLAGRRVRCPECQSLVDARDRETGTVVLNARDSDSDGTVLLEAIEVDDEEVESQPPAAATSESASLSPVHEAPVTEMPELTVPATGNATVGPSNVGQPPGPAQRHLDHRSHSPPEERPRWRTHEEDEPPKPLQSRWADEETEVDMTPMVDVTFLLLIFFMVTAAFAVQKSIEVPRPSDDQVSTNLLEQDPDDQADFVTVQVDQFNTFHVMTPDWEEEAPSKQDLYNKLRQSRSGGSTGVVPTKLRVEAHGDSLHGKVVTALDAGTATGFAEVQLATMDDE